MFQGCFNCGQTDHRYNRDCPDAKADNFDKNKFISKMWAHTPQTKKTDLQIILFEDSGRGNSNVLNQDPSKAHDNNSGVRNDDFS